MKVYNLNEFVAVPNAVVTPGTFDGVHLGHRTILARLIHIAKSIGGESVVTTFDPHPRLVLYPENNNLRLLNTLNEKIDLLNQFGIDHLVIIPFTLKFSRLSSKSYIEKVLVDRLNTKKLVIGYDHHFGKNREGSFDHLSAYADAYGFEVEEIPAKDIDDVNISSTKIREALLNGDIETATLYLGYNYTLEGTVVEGEQIGKKIGFPTANIKLSDTLKLIPGYGIYAVVVQVQEEDFKGMMYIGKRPTIGGEEERLEVNIFNFENDIYGKKIQIRFLTRIRDDKKFNSLDALKLALKKDKELVNAYFHSANNKQ